MGPCKILQPLAFAALLVLGTALSVWATPRKAVLHYERAEGAQRCPDEQVVKEAVSGRLGYSPFDSDAPVKLSVRIYPQGAQLKARLERKTTGGASATRELVSQTGDCAELVNALTLALSIGIDENFLAASAPAPAPSQDAGLAGSELIELFQDQGAMYLRAGAGDGVTMGGEVELLRLEKGTYVPAGRATVMQVWEHLARVNPDGGALAGRDHLYARRRETPNALKGTASSTGLGELRRVVVTNTGRAKWTGCKVYNSSGASYVMPILEPDESEGIMFFRFEQSRKTIQAPPGTVQVVCSEGTSTFQLEQ